MSRGWRGGCQCRLWEQLTHSKNSSVLLLRRNSIFCTSRRLTQKGDLLNEESFSLLHFPVLFCCVSLVVFICKVVAEQFCSLVMCQLLASMKLHFIYTLDLNRDICPTTQHERLIGCMKCEGQIWVTSTSLELNCYHAWYLVYVYRLSALSEVIILLARAPSHKDEKNGHKICLGSNYNHDILGYWNGHFAIAPINGRHPRE